MALVKEGKYWNDLNYENFGIVFLNEFDFVFKLFLDFVPFHTLYKAQIALQQKQQLAAVITAGNKREVPKVFSVELKMVRRRKIFTHRFNLWRSVVEGEAVRQEGHYYLYILKQNPVPCFYLLYYKALSSGDEFTLPPIRCQLKYACEKMSNEICM